MPDRETRRRGSRTARVRPVSLALALVLLVARPASAQVPPDGRTPQAIRVGRLPEVSFLDPDFEIEAAASSGLPVRFSASGDCSVRGPRVHLVSAGRCSITVSQPGDGAYQPAPDVEVRLSIGKAEQKIRMETPRRARFLDPDVEMEATASSGLPVVLVASGDCEVSEANGTAVRILSAGSCSVQALQPGDSNFTAARIVEASFEIARAGQSITFRLPSPLLRGTEVALSAAATSGLPVRFEAYGACWVVGSALRLAADGTCTVNADQAGDRNYEAARTVSRTVSVVTLVQ